MNKAIVFAALTLALGCASGPPDALRQQITRTDASIAQAEQAGAAEHGLAELQMAKDKRARVDTEIKERDYDVAMHFAQQAQLDAQYASRKSEAERMHRSAAAVQRGHESLRQEAERALEPR